MKHAILSLSLIVFAACSRPAAPPGAADEPRAAADAAPAQRVLRVAPAMQKKWGIGIGPVGRLTVSSSITLPGVVGLDQRQTAQISPAVEGKIVEVRADLGDTVRQNQVLAVIHSPAFAQAQIAYLQARARLDLARKEFERAKELLKQEAIQQREFLRREAEFEAATTEAGLQESNLHSLGIEHPRLDALIRMAAQPDTHLSDLAEPTLNVVSPIGGRIIFRDIVIGEHAHPDKILFTVSDLSVVWAFLDAREKDLPAINGSSTITIRCPVYADRSFPGRAIQVSDIVDEKLRTIKIRVEVPNPGLLLKPNMYIQGVVESTAGPRQVLAVPEEAIQNIDGTSIVFVVERPDAFAICPVEVGDRIGSSRTVTKGLSGSETIVLAGAFTLKSELMKSTLGGD
jgi:cobalt-zinc-cadmium efflux system membrane fusion protein